jgi:hypothetical protein
MVAHEELPRRHHRDHVVSDHVVEEDAVQHVARPTIRTNSALPAGIILRPLPIRVLPTASTVA